MSGRLMICFEFLRQYQDTPGRIGIVRTTTLIIALRVLRYVVVTAMISHKVRKIFITYASSVLKK